MPWICAPKCAIPWGNDDITLVSSFGAGGKVETQDENAQSYADVRWGLEELYSTLDLCH